MKKLRIMNFKCLAASFLVLPPMAVGHAGVLEIETKCPLTSTADGQIITVRGEVRQEPHDMVFDIQGCNEAVLLIYAGNSDSDLNATSLLKDQNLKRFRKYTSSVYKGSGKSICIECMKYGDVKAELTGKLEIAKMPPGETKHKPGLVRDESGKIIGTFGWGHPVPFANYRLVIESVSQVKAHKLPRQ
jgi:hypothetical protein